jgi:hypothetical protein
MRRPARERIAERAAMTVATASRCGVIAVDRLVPADRRVLKAASLLLGDEELDVSP